MYAAFSASAVGGDGSGGGSIKYSYNEVDEALKRLDCSYRKRQGYRPGIPDHYSYCNVCSWNDLHRRFLRFRRGQGWLH